MRLGFALVTVVVAACGDDGGMLPIGGGNDGGFNFPDGTRIDAKPAGDGATSDSTPAPIDASVFTGRVCLVADSRKLDACATTGAGGLTVRLGANSAVTADDGTFMIAGTNASVWSVSGANIVTSLKRVGDYEVPAIPRTMFTGMISQNLMPFPPNPGEGHVMAMLVRNGAAISGATATKPDAATWNPFYDGADATHWTQTSTSTNGVIWFPNIDVGTTNITVNAGGAATVMGLPVEDGAITFVTMLFP